MCSYLCDYYNALGYLFDYYNALGLSEVRDTHPYNHLQVIGMLTLQKHLHMKKLV